MKITHNKVGQNVNLIDGAKSEKSEGARAAKDARNGVTSGATPAGANQLGATKVDVSDRAQEAKRIKDLADAAPDVDAAKVEKFRRLIDAGQYKVDANAVADRMVDDHLETEL